MRTVPYPEDFLLNPRRFLFNSTIIKSFISNLRLDTPIIFLGSPLFKTPSSFSDLSTVPLPPASSPLPLTEPIYGTRYRKMNITRELTSYWTTFVVNGLLDLPSQNMFIPQNLSLLPISNSITPVKLIEGQLYLFSFLISPLTPCPSSSSSQTFMLPQSGGCRTGSSGSPRSTSTVM